MEANPATAIRWVIWGLILTLINGCWSLSLQLEDMRRKGQQRMFDTSPPLLPEWVFYSVHVLFLLQLVVSIVGVWQTTRGRWRLAGVLLVLWLTSVFFSGVRFG